MIGKAHEHFLKQKAEKQLIEDRKKIEEEIEKEKEKIRVLSKNVGPTRGEIGKAKGFEKKLTSKPTPTVKKKIMTFQVPSQPQTAEAEHSVYGLSDHEDVHTNQDPMLRDLWLLRSPAQLSKKIFNLKHTWRLIKRPGADSKAWRWTDRINEIFGEDATMKLLHIAEVNDGGGKKKPTPRLDNSTQKKIDWKAEIFDIEKERVEVLKEIASGQAKKTQFLTSAIEKIADNVVKEEWFKTDKKLSLHNHKAIDIFHAAIHFYILMKNSVEFILHQAVRDLETASLV
ncbi:Uncharacterized protein APZ42_025006 [Daphnia magna]|uniref:Uncharacterized protein n=1 Tax=Daphnia magna TaxID=35525 RepID=A0A164TJH3_9CRUS|nr:Uncharacterized protein APZ42_025006 [Daphnia magna]